MPSLTVLRGLPAAGKTTFARRIVAEAPTRRARVNRDDLRAMVHGGVFLGDDTERQIISAEHAMVAQLLRRGIDVVVDDTNLPSRTVRDFRRIAQRLSAEFRVVDLTNVPLDLCLERNAARAGREHVPPDRIREMHARHIAGRPYPLPIADEGDIHPEPDDVEPYVPCPGTPSAIVVDVDGTVALMANRSPYDERRVWEDRPNPPVIAAVRAMHAAGHRVVYCSGRTEACRAHTAEWLAKHVGVPFDLLLMRPIGDMRKDAIVKQELFDLSVRSAYTVICVFDDRNQVVAQWRRMGLTVFQVADGDF
jgi:predicted kinase